MTVCGEKMSGVCGMGKCPYIKLCNKGIFDKSPYKPQTNEEWIKTLNTEEMAKAITDFIKRIANAKEVELNINKEVWIRWLKEKHRGE